MKSDAFRGAVEAEDPGRSPRPSPRTSSSAARSVFRPYEGKPVVSAILVEGAMNVFEDFRYMEQLEDGDTAALIFKARVGDRDVDGLDLLRFDEEGKVARADGDGAADERPERARRGDGPPVRAAGHRAARGGVSRSP